MGSSSGHFPLRRPLRSEDKATLCDLKTTIMPVAHHASCEQVIKA